MASQCLRIGSFLVLSVFVAGCGEDNGGNASNPGTTGTTASKGLDPGPRGGPAGAGGPVQGLAVADRTLFNTSRDIFSEVDSVSGTVAGEDGMGLGPTFNANACQSCHSQPATGGSTPGLKSPQNPVPNPQVALA